MLVAAQLTLGIFSVFAGIMSEPTLPKELQDYLHLMAEKAPAVGELIICSIAIIAIVSNFGILFFAKWSRNLFTLTYLLTSVGMFLFGPTVQTGLITSIDEVEIFLSGFIVACMYLTDINIYFKK
jgi:hypothetical protein